MNFEISRHVNRRPEDIFAFLADIQQYTGRGTPVPVMQKIPSGPTRVGTRWREVVQVLPFATMTVWTIVESLVPDRVIASRFHSWWMQGHIEYRFTPDGGGTLFSWTETISPRGPLRVTDRLMDRLLRPRLVKRMEDICEFLDSGAPLKVSAPVTLTAQV